MSIAWLVPSAFAGLALIAVPIAIHLLIKHHSRQVAFPSLRFLQRSDLSALRRRSVQDLLLLVCRILIIAAAIAALAAPVIVTPGRQAAYANRVARAIVLEPGADRAIASRQSQDAFVSEVFLEDRLRDAVIEAVAWLDDQPPAARELVVVAAFTLGQLSDADLVAVPPATGVRLVPLDSAPASRDVEWPVLRRQGDALVREPRLVRLGDEATSVAEASPLPVPDEPIVMVAAPGDQRLANAALRAALTAGIHWPASAPARLVVAWKGAGDAAIARAAVGTQVVRMDVPSPTSSAASAVARAIAGVLDDPARTMEPVKLTRDQLARWERAPGAPPAAARPVDEGDRQWFWLAALALLGVEQILRAQSRRASREQSDTSPEARVA